MSRLRTSSSQSSSQLPSADAKLRHASLNLQLIGGPGTHGSTYRLQMAKRRQVDRHTRALCGGNRPPILRSTSAPQRISDETAKPCPTAFKRLGDRASRHCSRQRGKRCCQQPIYATPLNEQQTGVDKEVLGTMRRSPSGLSSRQRGPSLNRIRLPSPESPAAPPGVYPARLHTCAHPASEPALGGSRRDRPRHESIRPG